MAVEAHLVPQDLISSSENAVLCSVEQYIIQQYEGLKLCTEEQRKRDLTAIINQMESKFRDILIQKDQHIARARNRTAQLEQILNRAETEHQQWRNIALVKETQSVHLNNTLQQILLNHHTNNEIDGDAESCCEVGRNRGNRVCRGCGERDACVVFLPCRHLCCCVGCEWRIHSCLVCRCLKQNAVPVLLL